jgi:hypothetical protein
MMRGKFAVACLMALVFSGGCSTIETSLPLYDPAKDLVSDARLEGTWRWPDAGEVRIESKSPGVYVLIPLTKPSPATQPDEQGIRFELVQIGHYRYLFPTDLASPRRTSLFFCCRTEFVADQLRLRALNMEGLADYLRQNPEALTFKWHSVPPVLTQPGKPEPVAMTLTDSPQRIRQFMAQHEDDPGFVKDVLTLDRISPRYATAD